MLCGEMQFHVFKGHGELSEQFSLLAISSLSESSAVHDTCSISTDQRLVSSSRQRPRYRPQTTVCAQQIPSAVTHRRTWNAAGLQRLASEFGIAVCVINPTQGPGVENFSSALTLVRTGVKAQNGAPEAGTRTCIAIQTGLCRTWRKTLLAVCSTPARPRSHLNGPPSFLQISGHNIHVTFDDEVSAGKWEATTEDISRRCMKLRAD
ncbi:hypothetical protein ACU8KH_00641 [Lachancea thermotolerans]